VFILTESVSQLDKETIYEELPQITIVNHFFTSLFGTNLVKGIAATAVAIRLFIQKGACDETP
jgi:hypothetical protein